MNGFIIGQYLERVNHFLERVIIIFLFMIESYVPRL